jgi:hypothetical protein
MDILTEPIEYTTHAYTTTNTATSKEKQIMQTHWMSRLTAAYSYNNR